MSKEKSREQQLRENMLIALDGHRARIKEQRKAIKDAKLAIKSHKLLMKQAKILHKLKLLEK